MQPGSCDNGLYRTPQTKDAEKAFQPAILRALRQIATVAVNNARRYPMKIHNPATVAPGTGYSHGIELPGNARLLYLAGQIGVAPDGKMPPDIRGQAEQAWRNLEAILKAAGMG